MMYFIVGSWMFSLGWFLGAIYVQNHNETEIPAVTEQPERCPECEAWLVRTVASVSAD
jgi:hypothetical protein